ncbi:MAG: archease [Candidatus Acidiferrales bacterium]
MSPPFEIIEHPADVGFIAYGATREELFANAAHAMMTLACDPQQLAERESREVEVSGADIESLLYDWLAEILALSDAEQIFFRRAAVHAVEAGRIRGTVYGEKYNKQRHHAGTYIKAVTYHQLKVEQSADGWTARVYLDV